ncbi:MAG: hypothetical protein R2729_32895 [Bryobacteraceae bacterium]
MKIPAGPVKLGDYLDDAPAPVAPEPVVEVAAPVPPPPAPVVEPVVPVSAPVMRPVAAVPKRPPRKHINMTEETLQMLDELLIRIRQEGGERDVRASELIHGLTLALYEARQFLDLGTVPARGKWGSPSAAALPVALKETFTAGIAKGWNRRR